MLAAYKKWQALPVEKRKGFGMKAALWGAAIIVIAMVLAGRAHWLMGVLAALIALAGRAVQLAQYAPLFKKVYGDFSGQERQQTDNPRSAISELSRREAAEILGVEENASKDEVKLAHKRLMQKVHPDRGGSDALARQINAAKDELLKHL